MNKKITIILLSFFLVNGCQAQNTKQVSTDSATFAPNTVQVLAEVINTDDKNLVLKIHKVIQQGQGIITLLSEQDEITVRIAGKDSPPSNTKIEAYLREKISTGTSASSYILLKYKHAK